MRKSLTNKNIFLTTFMAGVTIAVLFWAFGTESTSPRQPQWAQPIQAKGLPNFFKVSDNLYRGAQPTAAGIAELKKMGIKTIVNLRSDDTDRQEISQTAIAYENIPMTVLDVNEQDIVRFLKIVTDKQKTPVFVHCQRGADRTGAVCAAYRIAVQGWTKQDAITEMTKGGFGFHPLWQNLVNLVKRLDVEGIKKAAGMETTEAK